MTANEKEIRKACDEMASFERESENGPTIRRAGGEWALSVPVEDGGAVERIPVASCPLCGADLDAFLGAYEGRHVRKEES